MQTVIVRRGSAKPLWAGHPWVHARAVSRIDGEPGEHDPDLVRVEDEDGRPIGHGLLSPGSALRVRLVETGSTDIDLTALLEARIHAAVALRRRLFPHPSRTNAYRLVHAEGDRLPGLVVDRYDDLLVAQFATGPIHRRRSDLARVLLEASGARGLVARAGGFEEEEGIATDDVAFAVGSVDTPTRWIREAGLWMRVEPLRGQKTGHYLDQRENRVHVGAVARGLDVLDLFAGTGGFALQALQHGARRVHAVDASGRALATARENAARNGLGAALDTTTGDVRAALRDLKQESETFDVVVLDPPNLFPRRGHEGLARKAYRDLGVQAVVRTRPGGFLASFSCSARLGSEALADVLRSAARECRRSLVFLRRLEAGPDHPVLAAAPEGRYLSGWLARVGP